MNSPIESAVSGSAESSRRVVGKSGHALPLPPGEAKKAWRAAMKRLFELSDAASRRGADAHLLRRIDAELTPSPEAVLLAFMPLADEPDITPVLRRWLGGGGWLAMPLWCGGRELRLRLVMDLALDLVPGRAGILCPREELPEVVPSRLAAALTPGRAFSESGDRLGRGAGCYDSLFAGASCKKIGVSYDFQIFPDLPRQEWDIPMDMVLTPGRRIVLANKQ